MIIKCPCGKKKFDIDDNLIPEKGRLLQCGSCDKTWFFSNSSKEIQLDKTKTINIKQKKIIKPKIDELEKDLIKEDLSIVSSSPANKIKYSSFSISNFLSLFLVLIITFVASIIFLDTFKKPLYNIFPSLELILFNLYETIKDIRLFIKDLFLT